MKFLGTLTTGNAVIHVWEDREGRIILGGIGWYEYDAYERLFQNRQPTTVVAESTGLRYYRAEIPDCGNNPEKIELTCMGCPDCERCFGRRHTC